MAGDWIPARLDLHEDPAIVNIAKHLGQTENEVVGAVLRVWGWFSLHTSNGRTNMSIDYLDGRARLTGVCEGMRAEGWLKVRGDGLVAIPHWETWLGASAKKRLKAARRQANKRLRDRHAGVTQPSRPKRDKGVTTGQDNIRSKNAPKSITTSSASLPDGGSARPAGAGSPPATASSSKPGRRLVELDTCPHCHGPTLLEPVIPETQFCTDHEGDPFPVSGVRTRMCATRRKPTCRSWIGERHPFGPQDCTRCVSKSIATARAAS